MATKLNQMKKTTIEEAQQITVKIVKENKDGSADAIVQFNKQGLETLVQWGMVSMLTAAVDAYRVRPEEGSTPTTKRVKAVAKKKASKK